MFRNFGIGKTVALAALLFIVIVLFILVLNPSCSNVVSPTKEPATASSAQTQMRPAGTALAVTVNQTTPSAPSPEYTPARAVSAPAATTAAPVKTKTAPPTATPAPSPAVTASPTAKTSDKPLAGYVIGIDAGHQAHADSATEPVAPGSSTMKAKVSSGTQGRFSRVPEYKVTLQVGLLLQKLLEEKGAKVVMTRTANDVDVSNVERAKIFNKAKVDLGLRLHCNGSTDPAVHGAFMLVPASKSYPYYSDCVRAAKLILAAYGKATGINVSKGITYRSDQTGFNWCERPVTNIEMGHMTNKEEDFKLTDADFQKKMAQGLCDGIVAYFAK